MNDSYGAPDGAGFCTSPEGAGEPDLDHLIAALEADRGPSMVIGHEVRAAARAAYAARREDAIMTEIGDDSLETPPTRVRDAAVLADAPRYLRFDAPGIALGLEVTAVEDRRNLVGRIDPPGPASAEIRAPQGAMWSAIDDDGAFVAPDVPSGPVSLVIHHPATPPIATPWLTF